MMNKNEFQKAMELARQLDEAYDERKDRNGVILCVLACVLINVCLGLKKIHFKHSNKSKTHNSFEKRSH